jgi:hypothetical protein
MVISIGFGLMFGSLIVLFVLPAFLVGIENANKKLTRVTSGLIEWIKSTTAQAPFQPFKTSRLIKADASTTPASHKERAL